MSTSANVAPDAGLHHPATLSPQRSVLEPYFWSVRREFWEYRSLYIAPFTVAVLFLLSYVVSVFRLMHKLRANAALDATQLRSDVVWPYQFAGLAIMGATFLVSIYYCFDTLHSERRDRSILFWKSLPVSDLTIVLAKATIPIVVLPLLTIVVTLAMHFAMLAIASVILPAAGFSGVVTWSNLPLVAIWTTLLYHMVAIHALWFSPFYCWMLLVSAWARRAPFLWGTLPILIIALVEKVAFNTTHFIRLLGSILGSAPQDAEYPTEGIGAHSLSHIHPGEYLFSPNLWIALTVAAVFLIAAARMRRYRGPN